MATFKLRFNLALKLWLVLSISTTLVIIGLVAWLQTSLDRGFRDYIQHQHGAQIEALKPVLEALYSSQGSWQPLLQRPSVWWRLQREAWLEVADSGRHERREEPPPRDHPPITNEPEARDDPPPRAMSHLLLADSHRQQLLGPIPKADEQTYWLALENHDQIVGFVGYSLPKQLRSPREVSFLRQQNYNFVTIGLFALVINAALAVPLAALLVRPIRRLEASTQALSRGEFHTRIDRLSNDELGSLAHHFNELAATLEANEQSRRNWVADISHELRTPVTFIKGQVEALIDGIRPTSRENLQALESQINHLSKLIDDLYQLSLSELGGLNYRKQWLPITPLLQQAVAQIADSMASKGLSFGFDNQLPEQCSLFIDADRISQLLHNLLMNSLRYTDAPGQVLLTASANQQSLQITLEDSSPGVDEAELPKLFERLYRADSSRNSQSGGAGIGLTLCRNIVTAHGGTIALSLSPLGGLRAIIEFPIERS
ncbi:ATP-binding protein [Halioxenophilus sp. WMMB6]|uniref:ATP-binding protein n=1 Tax=Halioxenophilus sp. WMMB6 TaxID=3073815 RepID=UPI00295E2859|nr:ATP-binding protein [Halioxenophilus sp. WMMB6]